MKPYSILQYSTEQIRQISNLALLKIVDILQEKGLDAKTAIVRAQEVFAHEHEKATLFMHNLQSLFDEGVIEQVYHFIANRALRQHPIDFSSYDQLVGMVQVTQKKHVNAEDLEKIKLVAQANRYGLTLLRVRG